MCEGTVLTPRAAPNLKNIPGMCAPESSEFGPFRFDPTRLSLHRHEARVALTATPGRVLVELLREPGTLVTHEALAEKIWQLPAAQASDAIRAAIRTLRQALRDQADVPIFIETVRGVGYRFVAPVVRAGQAASAVDRPVAVPPDLARWLAGDAGAVRFGVAWLAGTGLPVLVLAPAAAPLLLIPPVIRLALRVRDWRRVQREHSAAEILAAASWDDTGVADVTVPTGWRRTVRRGRNACLLAAVAAFAAMNLWIGLAPWKAGALHQRVFEWAFHGAALLAGAAVALLVVDAAVDPRPPFARVTRRLLVAWRAMLTGPLARRDAALLAAEREVEAILN